MIEDDSSMTNTYKIQKNGCSNIPSINIFIDDIELKVRQKLGDKVEEDALCNSEYMLAAMNRVGNAIQKNNIG